eukprot:Rhum_TRINITY_DN7340_c0_g2::Rhum_TRINITY_DN7340_c0_g2_i2::g.22698::m.22698/K03163/TOP1; DNA topoisomerase I
MPPRKRKVMDDDSDDVVPAPKKPAKKPASKKASPAKSGSKKGKAAPADSDSESEEKNWWDDEDFGKDDGGIKWRTLSHNGPMFPPAYVRHNKPITYEGKKFVMTEAEEEVATMFAVMRESDYYQKPVFRSNFFAAWKAILHQRPEGKKIVELALCNFDEIWAHHQEEQAKKKAMTAAEKKEKRLKADEEKTPYKFVMWDGRKEKIANPVIEPPGLFRGRGLHPKMGCLKPRTYPEDVTINCEDVKKPPTPPAGRKWGAVVSDNTVTWLAKWHDRNTGDVKYTQLDKSGAMKQWKDKQKFEMARRLKDIIKEVRDDYEAGFKSKDMKRLQMSVAMYFIDKLALRVGGDKGEDEADTVGCCSLRAEHITPFTKDEKFFLNFDFLGKDSIRYYNDVEISEPVYHLVKKLLVGKDSRPLPKNQVFNEVETSDLNAHFKKFMTGLSAKVFRTYNASFLLDKIFEEEPVDSKLTEAEKMVYFNKANTKVAILCNHQRTVAKGHEAIKEGMNLKIEEIQSQIDRLNAAKKAFEKAPKSQKDKVWEKHRDEYNEQENEKFEAWVEEWGKEEDKKKWAETKEKEGGTSKKSAAKRKSTASSPKAKRPRTVKDDSDSDDEVLRNPKKGKKKDDSSDESPAAPSDSSDDDVKAKKAGKKTGRKPAAKRGKKADPESESESESESEEEDKKPAKKAGKKAGKKPAAKKGKKEESESEQESESESEEEDKKPAKKAGKKAGRKPAAKKGKKEESESEQESESESEEEDKKPAKKAGKKAGRKPAAKKGKKEDPESDSESEAESSASEPPKKSTKSSKKPAAKKGK